MFCRLYADEIDKMLHNDNDEPVEAIRADETDVLQEVFETGRTEGWPYADDEPVAKVRK